MRRDDAESMDFNPQHPPKNSKLKLQVFHIQSYFTVM